MPISYVEYELKDQYIVNWLAAGPQIQPVGSGSSQDQQDSTRELIAERFFEKKSQISIPPVERGPLSEGVFSIGAYQGEWNYYACREDRLVDHSLKLETCSYVRSWAYSELHSPHEQAAQMVISAYGPVDIWVNKKLVYHLENFSKRLESFTFPAKLQKGTNRVLVRFANVASGPCALAVALRIQDADGIRVRIPSLIPALERRNQLEAMFDRVSLKRDVFIEGQSIELLWPDDLPEVVACDARLQTRSGRIYGQTEDAGKPGDRKVMGMPVSLMDGQYQIYLMPRAWEMYESQIRITKKLDLWVMGRSSFSAQPYGTPDQRRREALLNAAQREGDLFGEIAKMVLGRWDAIEERTLTQALERVQRQEIDSAVLLLALLGALLRYGEQDGFQQAWKDYVRESALQFAYTKDDTTCAASLDPQPDQQIITLACAILAGQLYPDSTFTHTGQTGEDLRAEAEANALAWIRGRGLTGYASWDSTATYAAALTALSHLTELAQNEELWELSALLMDQILFTLALYSCNGVFGAPQGRASTISCISSLLNEVTGITRLLWGMGSFNHHSAGIVSMACLQNYPFPELIAQIGADHPQGLWSRQRHNQPGSAVDSVAYRTEDYLLASAQDYQPGQPGSREHVWQATLGPQCAVFTTHPGSARQDDAQAPNFWLGNGYLPRVAQWKDTLVAIYNAPDDAWMDFTHAHFSTADFDETVIEQDTIYGRKGKGYIALSAVNGLQWIGEGRTAFRELRSPGRQNIWLCRMGQEKTDGDFHAFIARVKALQPAIQGLDLSVETIRGEQLAFGWQQPLLVNGQEQPLHNFPRFANDYITTDPSSTMMEVRNSDYLLRWNFGLSEEN